MAGAAAIPIIGSVVSAQGAQDAADAKASAANFNASVNLTNADQAIQQSVEEQRKQQVFSSQQIGEARANYGASGVSSASGSALDALQQSNRNAALDSLQIKHAGDMKAWAYKSGATLDQMQASASKTAGSYGVASALFGGVSQGLNMANNFGGD